MTEVKFTKQRVEDYHSNNYFGCEPDTSVEEQKEIKRVWIENMENRGWILDESVIYHDPGFGLSEIDDRWVEYEIDSMLALQDSIQHLEGAF